MASTGRTELRVEELSIEQLDYCMYIHACELLNKKPSTTEFSAQYAKGRFQFTTDSALLDDLLTNYSINIQNLGGDWLASNCTASAYGVTPTEAACRLILKLTYGSHLPLNDQMTQ